MENYSKCQPSTLLQYCILSKKNGQVDKICLYLLKATIISHSKAAGHITPTIATDIFGWVLPPLLIREAKVLYK